MRDTTQATDVDSKIRLLDKVKISKESTVKTLDLGEYPVIAFSGGKDSLLVPDPVRQIDPSVEAVFCNFFL
ncbi:hypothetical protein [Methanomethylovorans sp.]|uniref:hypothetical protein n=1 Tax=Methanomethylovorans sp. TaxID=2758717 RepID=UPI00351C2CD5